MTEDFKLSIIGWLATAAFAAVLGLALAAQL